MRLIMQTKRKTLRNKNKLGNIQMLNCKRSLFKCLKLGLITNGGLDMLDLMRKPNWAHSPIMGRFPDSYDELARVSGKNIYSAEL